MPPRTCGRLHPDDMDWMAHDLADHIIETQCFEAAKDAIVGELTNRLTKRGHKRRPNFAEYYAFLAPHEERMKRGLATYWGGQRKTVIGNMRRSPMRSITDARVKGLTFAELFEQWMFAKGPANKALQVIYRDLATKLMVASAVREERLWGLSTNWDVFNPNIEKWLKTYSIDLADEINTQTLDKLKASLFDGWEAGESIPDLTNRVKDLYEEFDTSRAEMIARSESIRASSQGALAEYEASGVVDRVMWAGTPDERECPICEGLDGKVADLGEAFPFEDDYGDGSGPPAHPNCRCCLFPILEGETVSEEGGIE